MSTYRLLGAAAALAVITTPAMAQQVIYEPGYCAFYYPNANCQNKGPGNPYTGDPGGSTRATACRTALRRTASREEANASIPDIHAVTAALASRSPCSQALQPIGGPPT